MDHKHLFAERLVNLPRSGGLMMIMSYLLRTSIQWRGVEVRLKMVVQDEAAATQVLRNLTTLIQRFPTNATPEVIVAAGRSFPEILQESSADADLVFMGMAEPSESEAFARYYARIRRWIEPLPTVALVLAAEDTPFDEVLVQRDVTMHHGS